MALIFILLYAPIVTLVVLSFNASKTRAKWGGFTLHWYRSLFANTEIMNALYTTLIIALLASAIACSPNTEKPVKAGLRSIIRARNSTKLT